MDIKVLVTIAQGTEELEAVTIIDLCRRAGMTVIVAGNADIITCSRGLKIVPEVIIDNIHDYDDFDAIILPGGNTGVKHLIENIRLEKILKNQKQKGKLIAAICAAPTILDAHNLISENNTITSHPGVKSFLEKYNYLEDKVVIDNNIITSRGAGTAIDFTLAIIEKLINIETAVRIANDIVYSIN